MPEITKEKRYDPVGHCIYCGRTGEETELSAEHIIPAGLGGMLILPDASCAKCRGITGEIIEQQCLRRMLGGVRQSLGLRRRKRSSRDRFKPNSMRIETAGGTLEITDPSVGYRIDVATLFAFDTPTILLGEPPLLIRQAKFGDVWCMVSGNRDFVASAKDSHPNALRLTTQADSHPNLFQRMLAKIGHSFLTAELGAGNFDPLLGKMIIGEDYWMPGHYVGGIPTEQPKSEYLTEIGWRARKLENGQEYAVVQFRLFGHYGGPIYLIVAGGL